ncbi:thermostable hemolysin [Alloalcanivorax xenomutans]|uniref:thermostable hemolysin n=1 Tax=Alloalcanivorax xenomutans TaxID=1094342 RepID=UPI0024E23336|nr:thermostable hemolysin [Alloalcanivorax xenomutans]
MCQSLSDFNPQDALQRRLTLHGVPLQASLTRRGDTDYRHGAAFVRRRYWLSYGARPTVNAPFLMVLKDDQGHCRAAAGLTRAAGQSVFLEQYLPEPLEHCITLLAGVPVSRDRIIEISSLAADGSGTGRLLFIAMTALLPHLQGDWIAFTATRQVRNIFHRLGLAPVALTTAEPDRLNGGHERWGRYYDHDPQVMAGQVAPGHDRLVQAGWITGGEVRHDVVA